MRLTRLRLANWKAFRNLDIALDERAPGNIFVIEGKNGFGKTSILEAIALGLYGREGLRLVGSSNGRPPSYDGFLERALCSDARGAESTMSVELAFESDDDRFIVQRSWYFAASGRHRGGDEEVRLWSGPDEDIVPLPDGGDAASFAVEVIAERLLPARLAPFFLFDGEQIDKVSSESLEQQVRGGVEAALGIPLLKTLTQDLLAFAREARRAVRGDLGVALNSVVQGIASREQDLADIAARQEALGGEIEPLRQERDAIVARIGDLSGESYANFKALFEQRERSVRDRDEVQDRLRRLLSVDLALALAGSALRASARARLTQEAALEQSAAADAASEARFARFLEALAERDLSSAADRESRRTELEAVWATTRSGLGQQRAAPRHRHLTPTDRHLVESRFDELDGLAGDAIACLAQEVERADRAVAALDAEIADQRGADEQSRALATALGATQQRIGELEEAARTLGRSRDTLESELAELMREQARLADEIGSAEPSVHRAAEADRLAAVVESLIARLFPLNLKALSASVTRAYRAMAHKERVSEIEILPDGTLRMVDAEGGDLRQFDLSAGEKQLFAFALMAGIVLVSPPFPMILDTPLARLDPEHRNKVLTFLAGLDRQIIFLSQPAELSAGYRDALGEGLAQMVRLDHALGTSRVVQDSRAANAA